MYSSGGACPSHAPAYSQNFDAYSFERIAVSMLTIVAKNITKYCFDESFRFNLRPLKSLSRPRGPTGREGALRATSSSASRRHVAASEEF